MILRIVLAMLKVVWFIINGPSYIVLWLSFYWPTETGKNRNVAESRRKWKARHVMAPIGTAGLIFCFTVAFPGWWTVLTDMFD